MVMMVMMVITTTTTTTTTIIIVIIRVSPGDDGRGNYSSQATCKTDAS
jgi:hypothetical protein